jgi:hypothetical protein
MNHKRMYDQEYKAYLKTNLHQFVVLFHFQLYHKTTNMIGVRWKTVYRA